MRALPIFFFLVAANVVMALWLLRVMPLPPEPSKAPPIVLWSEQPSSKSPVGVAVVVPGSDTTVMATPPVVPHTPAPVAPTYYCLELAEFADQLNVERARRRLTDRTVATEIRAQQQIEPSSYWVNLPPAATRAEALEIARTLAGKGIEGYYVVTTGAEQNSISLGLFASKENANGRLREVRAAGFSAQINERGTTRESFRLFFKADSADRVQWRALLPDFTQLKETPVVCPEG